MNCVRLFQLILSSAPSSGNENDLAATLFHHILDSRVMEIFPGIKPVILPFGISVNMLVVLLAAAVILAVFFSAVRKISLKPKGPALILEMLVLFVRNDITVPVMGKERGEKWLAFFSALFLFLLTVNFLGLFPAFKAATGSLSVTTALSFLILLIIFIYGLKSAGFAGFFKHMFPQGAPLPVGLFVAFLEFSGFFIKTMVLSLRLFANMFAGHLAILSFLALIFVLSPLMAAVAVPFSLFVYILELLVAFIQALVFTLLSCIFINMAVSEKHAD